MRFAKRKNPGFTLIEIIGVLAVLSILAAMILPNIISEVNRASGDAEETNLKTLATGLESYITQYRVIPGTTAVAAVGTQGAVPANYINAVPTWDNALVTATRLPLAKVQNNDKGNPRYYVWDQNGAPTLPYQQRSAGAGALTGTQTRPRIIIISSVGPTLGGIASGQMTTANFQSLWDWDGNTPTQLTAAGITGVSTSDQAKDIRIQRINLDHLFNTVSLSNRRSTSAGRTSFISATSATAQPVITVPASAASNLTIAALRYNVYAFQTNMPDTLGTPIGVTISTKAGANCTGLDQTVFGNVATANAGSGGFVTGAGTPMALTASTPLCVTMSLATTVFPTATWVAATAYVVNNTVAPTAPNGFFYKCTVAGTSGAAAPAWPVVAGANVVDGTVTWQAVAPAASGTVDVEADYSANSYYSLDEDSTPLTTVAPDVAPTQIYVLEKTKLNLFDNATTPVTPITTYFINASESFWFSPGPPAMWGR